MIASVALGLALVGAEPQLERSGDVPQPFLERYCFACHADGAAEGGLELEELAASWGTGERLDEWERVVTRVESREMPPRTRLRQPTDEERAAFAARVHAELAQRSTIGGTVARRLTRREYANAVRDLFGIDFVPGGGFPADEVSHGFDRVASAQHLSAALLSAYLESATRCADRLFPPPLEALTFETQVHELDPAAFEAPGIQTTEDVPLRLALSQDFLASSAAWPATFQAQQTGTYRVEVRGVPFTSAGSAYPDHPPQRTLRLLARPADGEVLTRIEPLRSLGELRFEGELAVTAGCEVELHRGETVALWWTDGPVRSAPGDRKLDFEVLRTRLLDPAFFVAWVESAYDSRDGLGNPPLAEEYAEFRARLEAVDPATVGPTPIELLRREAWRPLAENENAKLVNLLRYELAHTGPALDVLGVRIEGPLALGEDPRAMADREAGSRLAGSGDGRSVDARARAVLGPLLSRAFRRPVDEDVLSDYAALAVARAGETGRLEDGLHAAVRTMLVSPLFLFRGGRPGRLDAWDLAARLAAFAWSAPPDDVLRTAAADGSLLEPEVLRAQTLRLLADPRCAELVRDFTGQWLGAASLAEVQPDPRLLAFVDADREAMIAETELFFSEHLQRNLPLQSFIAPEFTFLNERLATRIYDVEGVDGAAMRRVTIPADGALGGILGQATVMMATANGVDTQPVLRGVWLLDNVLGAPPPPPPGNVPAISSDSSGATDIRELLERHRADPACARCHDRIDPLGYALESYDPIGRWRTHYAAFETVDGVARTVPGRPVDPSGRLPDGTELADVTDLKRYLVEHVDQFGVCLATKLLVYATGREPSYAERRIARTIVDDLLAAEGGFRDLVVALVDSEVFRTR